MYRNYIGFQQNVGRSTEIYLEDTVNISLNSVAVSDYIYHIYRKRNKKALIKQQEYDSLQDDCRWITFNKLDEINSNQRRIIIACKKWTRRWTAVKKQKLNYRLHDPNDPAVAAEYILKVFVEANQKKVERVIREAGRGKEEKCT